MLNGNDKMCINSNNAHKNLSTQIGRMIFYKMIIRHEHKLRWKIYIINPLMRNKKKKTRM